MKPSYSNDNLDDDLVGRARKIWQPRFGRELSRDDARQIAANLTGFFSVLAEWSRAESPTPANDPTAPTVSAPTEAHHER